jgi:transcriptional regulator with XRE-family HTH domain
MTITSAQCRAARGLIEMSQADLASAAVVTRGVIIDFENGSRVPQRANMDAIQHAFETAGVIFVEENGEGPGVRLRKGQDR